MLIRVSGLLYVRNVQGFIPSLEIVMRLCYILRCDRLRQNCEYRVYCSMQAMPRWQCQLMRPALWLRCLASQPRTFDWRSHLVAHSQSRIFYCVGTQSDLSLQYHAKGIAVPDATNPVSCTLSNGDRSHLTHLASEPHSI